MFLELFNYETAEVPRTFKGAFKLLYRNQGFLDQLRNQFFACGRTTVINTLLNSIYAVIQRLDKQISSLLIEEHVFLQIRITLNYPDISQHLEHHSS